MDAADLAFAGMARQAELVAAAEVSSRELVDVCLERIERLDPKLNAFRVVFGDQARAAADQVDARGAGGAEQRPALLGVPIAVKDDADVAGEVTAWGSRAHGPPPTQDAEVVRRLRAAGAIVIGKTSVPELTIWPFTESEAFGATRNPWNPEHTPGGSSGGAAAAVASGMVACALGSDGGGSIRIPAACCGLFGLKPQRGRVPLSPRPEAWQGLSVNGPLARRVVDAALFLDITAGPGPGDIDRTPAPPRPFVEAATTPPGKLRIAFSAKVPAGLIARVGAQERRVLQDTAQLLASLGHQISWEDPAYGLASTRFTARYLRGIHHDAHELVDFERLESRSQGMARMGGMLSPRLVARARRAEVADAARINAIYEHNDVLVTPALATSPPRVDRWQGRGALATFNGVARFVPFQAVWNHIGQPGASVPVGMGDHGLPLSVQLLGRAGDEATLLSLASQLEAERPWAERRPPIS